METAEILTDAEECLAQTTALVNAIRRLASRWEAAGDHAHAAELLSVASAAMSGATDETEERAG